MTIIKYTFVILGSTFILLFVGMFLWHEVSFHKTIYLDSLGKPIEKYFDDDYYKAEKHVVVNVSTLTDNKILMAAIKDCPKKWLDATKGNVILGYKNGELHSFGLPRKHWDWCGTGKPSIVIPIIVTKIHAISFEFRDIEFFNYVYKED
jgi:hypothetical protein